MGATYNWAYKPGIVNKYGLTVPAGADDVRPAGWAYVALFGNDTTGNGSRQRPFKSLVGALTAYGNTDTRFVLGSGVFREDLGGIGAKLNQNQFIGDGDVTIDYSYFLYLGGGSNFNGSSLSLYNIKIVGSGYPMTANPAANFPGNTIDCLFSQTVYGNSGGIASLSNTFQIQKNVFENYPKRMTITGGPINLVDKCTFYNMGLIEFGGSSTWFQNCIFVRCNISVTGVTDVAFPRNCLFYQCNWKMGTIGAVGATYPTLPAGYTYYSDMASIIAACVAAYPTNQAPFPKCIVADPKFNNAATGDYTLAFDSPAKNLTYFGTYVGAKSIGQSIRVRASESLGGFDFSTAINLTIADDSITLTNPAIDAQIDTKVMVNTLARQISNFMSYGFNADRNGQYIDSIADLDTVVRAVGDALAVPAPYIVEGGAITYNGAQYQPGERFTTVNGQTTFTTVASGVVREILESPQRHTIMARFGDGGATVAAGAALTIGNHYYVQTGNVTYETIIYVAGAVFKAVNANPFTGSGTVSLALSTEAFQHYEPGTAPTTNNVGDARNGAIIRGNGDPAYVRGGLGVKEFPINAKFLQVRYHIRVSNLKP